MIGREFVKHLRLRHGRTEIIRTRFELKGGQLVEHVTLETHDRPTLPGALQQPPAEEGQTR